MRHTWFIGADASSADLVGNFELEMGVSYTKLDAKPTTSTLNGTYSGITFTNASASLEAKDMTTMHVGLNYRF